VAGNQGADQFGGELAEGDAVAAIAIGGKQVLDRIGIRGRRRQDRRRASGGLAGSAAWP